MCHCSYVGASYCSTVQDLVRVAGAQRLILAPQRSKNLKDRLVKHKIYTKGKSTTCMFNLEFIIDTYGQFQKIWYVQAARPII